MRRTVGIIVISVALGTAAFVVATIGGRFSDGPLRAIPGIPGGPFSGEAELCQLPSDSEAKLSLPLIDKVLY